MSAYQPEETIKYVQVPVDKEVIVKVPKRQYVDRIREVPKIEYVFTDKVVEIPRLNVVEKLVEIPEYVERIKHVPVTKVVEVPHDVITYVPKVEVKVIEKEVQVPGEVIQVRKRTEILEKKIINKYIDSELPTIVAQTYRPHVVESQQHIQTVKLKKYVPYLVPVQVPCPVAVSRELTAGGTTDEQRPLKLPAAHYNARLKAANPNLTDEELSNVYKRNDDGSIAFLEGSTGITQPV